MSGVEILHMVTMHLFIMHSRSSINLELEPDIRYSSIHSVLFNFIQTYNIWLGLAGKVKRLNTLKISGNPAEPEETRSKIDFFIERKIDQSSSEF